MAHPHSCRERADWTIARAVVQRGFRIADFPCVHVAHEVTHQCELHADLSECPDVLVLYAARFDEYHLRDGDGARRVIYFCPWCAAPLPESKRDRWFAELDSLGFDDPLTQDIPAEFRSNAWFRSPGSR